MRLHISLDDDLVRDLDSRVGRRGRSPFIAHAVRTALDDDRRWGDIEDSLGRLSGTEHEWDADPGAWVHEQRGGDSSRVG